MKADEALKNEHEDISKKDIEILDNLVEELHGCLDDESIMHTKSENVYAQMMAEKLGLPALPKMVLYYAVMFHDVGKAKISKKILKKEGPLDNEERIEMEKHVIHSIEMVGLSKQYRQLSEHAKTLLLAPVLETVAYHHRYYDLSGYSIFTPEYSVQIPMTAQIMHAADMLDASTRRRCYHYITQKPLRTPKEAQHEVKKLAGRQFNPIVAHIVQQLEFEPVFSLYAQLKDDKYWELIRDTLTEVDSRWSKDKSLESQFEDVQPTPHGAPYQIGYSTPYVKGHGPMRYVRERDMKHIALAQDRQYGIEVLADGRYESFVANLALKIAKREGYDNELERVAKVFNHAIPAYLNKLEEYWNNKDCSPDIGNAFALDFDSEKKALRVMMRNQMLNYEKVEEFTKSTLQPMLDAANGGSTTRLLESREPVVEVVIPMR